MTDLTDYQKYILQERKFLDSIPKDSTDEEIDDFQLRLDAIRAKRNPEDSVVSTAFYAWARVRSGRLRLSLDKQDGKHYHNILPQVLGAGA